MSPLDLLWIFFILSSLQPVIQRQLLASARRRALAAIARRRDATVITPIHQQETMSLLGFPIVRHIDIDDAESVLRAIRGTPPGRTIETILHTLGGLVLAASQIAQALRDHDGRVVAMVPHYAMSGATLIALAADEIVLDSTRRSGPSTRSSASTRRRRWSRWHRCRASRRPTLLLADVGRKAIRQVELLVRHLLEPERPRTSRICCRPASGPTTTRSWPPSSSCSACPSGWRFRSRSAR
jgi:hypothetical protein